MPAIATVAWSVRPSVRLSHLCTLLKPSDGMRCYVANWKTLVLPPAITLAVQRERQRFWRSKFKKKCTARNVSRYIQSVGEQSKLRPGVDRLKTFVVTDEESNGRHYCSSESNHCIPTDCERAATFDTTDLTNCIRIQPHTRTTYRLWHYFSLFVNGVYKTAITKSAVFSSKSTIHKPFGGRALPGSVKRTGK